MYVLCNTVEYVVNIIINILAGRWVRDWTRRGARVAKERGNLVPRLRGTEGGCRNLPVTRGASNPRLTEPASMFSFHSMP